MASSAPGRTVDTAVSREAGSCARLLAVGTYERAVVGFALREEGADVRAELTFTNAVHTGAVRCVASHGGVLSSGGADDAIQLCDLRRRVELGSLQYHEGSVNCMAFHSAGNRSFMFSASDDGSICVWKCPRWERLHVLRGHKGAVNSFSLHPSGRVALSVGRDRTLRTWNLISGRLAYTTRLPKVGEAVEWSPDGRLFAVLFMDSLNVYDAASVSVKHQISDEGRQLTSFKWVSDDSLLLGTGKGRLLLFQIGEGEESVLFQTKAHEKRVKALTAVFLSGDKVCIASVGSDSVLKIWNLQEHTVRCVCSRDVPGRPTCVAFCLHNFRT